MLPMVAPQVQNNVPAFLSKLWKMVDDPETDSLISWSDEGNSFIIHNQVDFTHLLLPYYYKHSNMASFVRQLNMYGFHKVVAVESGGLIKSEKQDGMEFAHAFFIRGNEHLLENIKRKVAKSAAAVVASAANPPASFVPSLRQDKVNEVLNEVNLIKDKQEDMTCKLESMKKENEAFWRELVAQRQKLNSQQKIINKVIHFLMSIVQQPRMNSAMKRKYPSQLAIEDTGIGVSTPSKLGRTNEASTASSITFQGPVIHEVTTMEDDDPLIAALKAVDPSLVNPAIKVVSSSSSPSSSSSSSKPAGTANKKSPSQKFSTAMVTTANKRPTLQREISKEDFDLETTLMQKDLDNLKDILSGQISLDTNILSNLFSPDEPLMSTYLPASMSSTADSMYDELHLIDAVPHTSQPLQLQNQTTSSPAALEEQPHPLSLFELADMEDDNLGKVTSPPPDHSVSDVVCGDLMTPLLQLDDEDNDLGMTLNTPLVSTPDLAESPLITHVKKAKSKRS